jgi:hypothetical protein
MAKGRGGRSREEKKPKADKKAPATTPSFLRPQAVDSKTAAKENKK